MLLTTITERSFHVNYNLLLEPAANNSVFIEHYLPLYTCVRIIWMIDNGKNMHFICLMPYFIYAYMTHYYQRSYIHYTESDTINVSGSFSYRYHQY